MALYKYFSNWDPKSWTPTMIGVEEEYELMNYKLTFPQPRQHDKGVGVYYYLYKDDEHIFTGWMDFNEFRKNREDTMNCVVKEIEKVTGFKKL